MTKRTTINFGIVRERDKKIIIEKTTSKMLAMSKDNKKERPFTKR